MCGIFGYAGDKNCASIIVNGLKDLEYRGYDSAGIYVSGFGAKKSTGPVKNLEQKTLAFSGKTGIAHTRWATHGEPSENNAHPHTGIKARIWVVHNGVIENYKELKCFLEKNVSKNIFKSDTDTEVIPHLIEYYLLNFSIKESIIKTVNKLRGAYALAIIDSQNPDTIYVVKNQSPLIIGLGKRENFISSDSRSLNKHTNKLIFLEDREFGIITKKFVKFYDFMGEIVKKKTLIVKSDLSTHKVKNKYKDFMFGEIMEQPNVFSKTLKNRIKNNKIFFKEIVDNKIIENVNKIIIVGCGTAYNSGFLAKYFFEEELGIATEIETSSEFRYRNHPIDKKTLVIAVSQSGETADTREAIMSARLMGAKTVGIVNVVGSTISRQVDLCIYTNAGPEISVASTKAFTSQVLNLILFGLFIKKIQKSKDGIGKHSQKIEKEIIRELKSLPKKMKKVLDQNDNIREIAKRYLNNKNFLFIGRKYQYPIALESCLKLKEISYVHAEGCGAGDLKHGPLAMIDENFPVVILLPKDSLYEKNISTVEEIRARRGKVIAITNENLSNIRETTNNQIIIPKSSDLLGTILFTIALQLFAYNFADLKGINVDKPRNLAKSVTVE